MSCKQKKGGSGMLLYLAILAAALLCLCIVWCCTASHADTAAGKTCLSILMYHDVCTADTGLDDYTVSARQLEADLAALQAEGWTPVTLSAVISCAEGSGALPDRPVLLVFDDGYKSFLTTAYPLLCQYETPAVVSLIGQRVQGAQEGQPAYSAYLDWSDLRQLAESEWVEFQSHSDMLHQYTGRRGAARLPGESDAQYTQVLEADIQAMADLCTANGITLQPAFAYPYGQLEPLAEEILSRQGFAVTMTSEEHSNLVTQNPDSLHLLGRLNRSGHLSTEEVLCWLAYEWQVCTEAA